MLFRSRPPFPRDLPDRPDTVPAVRREDAAGIGGAGTHGDRPDPASPVADGIVWGTCRRPNPPLPQQGAGLRERWTGSASSSSASPLIPPGVPRRKNGNTASVRGDRLGSGWGCRLTQLSVPQEIVIASQLREMDKSCATRRIRMKG